MQRDRRSEMPRRIRSLGRSCGAAVLSASLALGGPVRAQQAGATLGPLIEAVTEGKGPGEKVTGFRMARDAAAYRLPDADVAALGRALAGGSDAARTDSARDLGMKVLGFTSGGIAALGTLAEHALWVNGMSSLNNGLNNVGFVIALAQVARDAANGNDAAAVTGGVKAFMSFAISRWGWGALQIGGVALFVTDVLLTQWQSGLTGIATDVWTCRYQAWYKENGRSIGDWKVKAWELFLAAESRGDSSYETYIDGALNEYVGRAFRDTALDTYGDCGTSSFGDRDYIHRIIEAEHKAVLRRMLAEKVMPEIADRAWLRQVRGQIAEAEWRLKPKLNKEYLLDVTAYGVEGEARIVMPLPAGGEWSGKLRPEGTFKAKLTLYAVMKAGFPDTVRLETEAGTEERKLVMSGDRLTAMFGAPETPLVSRYTLSEGPQTCTVRRIAADGSVTTESATAEARPAAEVDFAMLANGAWVFGRYSPDGGWSPASPGTTTGTRITLGAPLHDNIRAFSGCSVGFLADDALAAGDCTVERFERKAVSAKVTIERICTAKASLDMAGVFSSLTGEGMTYFPLDGPEGKALVEILKRSMKEGVKGFEPGSVMVPGMPGMPGMPN